jgi:hypothetical protein
MKYLIPLFLLSGCGVDVKGLRDVKVTHEINVDSIEKYVQAYCELGNELPGEIEACVNAEIGKILSKI